MGDNNGDGAKGPDLAKWVPLADIPEGDMLAGHVDNEPVLLSRLDGKVFAVSGKCTHYGAPLGDGLVKDCQVRCPWHHAHFDLRTGASLAAPAFAPLQTWQVELADNRVRVLAPADPQPSHTVKTPPGKQPRRIVIIGGGAAGFSAAQRLRQLGYDGALHMLSADVDAPYDRPNLSKDYLAGTAQADWMPLKAQSFYEEHDIELQLRCEVTGIDAQTREVRTADGTVHGYDKLLLATGAEPVRLDLPGFDAPQVHTLRSMADARALIDALGNAKSVALIGAGFIGLEAAAALRERGVTVHVVAREADPMTRILGPDMAAFLIDLHREHGVEFHLEHLPVRYDSAARTLEINDGSFINADLVLVGVGVRPRIALAERAGLDVDKGVRVNAQLQTSNPDIYAVGDIARFPFDGAHVRIEHWVHAERQGQHVAANLLGADEPFTDLPFFWSHHYGMDIRYTGHAQDWDEARLDGSPQARDACVRLLKEGRLLAAVTLGRDLENLQIERELEHSLRG